MSVKPAEFLVWACVIIALLGRATVARAEISSVTAAADTFINSGIPGNNAGGHAWFDTGTDGQGGARRGLIRFDVSGSIPTGSTIHFVELRLKVVRVPPAGPVNPTVSLFRLEAAWGEGIQAGNSGSPATAAFEVTWYERWHGIAPWTTPGALNDAAATASAASPVGAVLDQSVSWIGLGMITDVQSWLDGPAQNFGWLLVSDAENQARSVRGFASRENTLPEDRPMLIVNYTPPTGAPQYALFVSTNGGGLVTKNPDQASYVSNTVVTLTATPNAGWGFSGWGGDAGGMDNPISVTMTNHKAITATFTNVAAINWFTVNSGGGTSTGAVFAVRGTIGQYDAGRLTNGTTVLNGGFWGGLVAVQTPGAPLLSIAYTTTNTVVVFWPSPSTGFVLQQNTNDVSSMNWSNAPGDILDDGTNRTHIVNPPTGNRFYRLHKP